MATMAACEFCGFDIPTHVQRCPHCGRPSRFPNVLDAETPEERDALDVRYRTAQRHLDARGCGPIAGQFEGVVNEESKAVICRSIHEVERLAKSDLELYATYYQLWDGEVKLPVGDKWDRLRGSTDSAVFFGYHKEIHFAALVLDGQGLTNYGECSLTLRDDMIEYRTSVFEENTVLFTQHKDLRMAKADDVPKGYRATWAKRGKLCISKLFAQIQQATTRGDFPKLLLKQGKTSTDDEFVEVHVFGPMTIRTVDKVVVTRRRKRPSKAILKALGERLDKQGVDLEVR